MRSVPSNIVDFAAHAGKLNIKLPTAVGRDGKIICISSNYFSRYFMQREKKRFGNLINDTSVIFVILDLNDGVFDCCIEKVFCK